MSEFVPGGMVDLDARRMNFAGEKGSKLCERKIQLLAHSCQQTILSLLVACIAQ